MHGMCLEWSGSDEEIESKVSAEGGDEHGDVEDMHYLYVQPKEHDSDAEPFKPIYSLTTARQNFQMTPNVSMTPDTGGDTTE